MRGFNEEGSRVMEVLRDDVETIREQRRKDRKGK